MANLREGLKVECEESQTQLEVLFKQFIQNKKRLLLIIEDYDELIYRLSGKRMTGCLVTTSVVGPGFIPNLTEHARVESELIKYISQQITEIEKLI